MLLVLHSTNIRSPSVHREFAWHREGTASCRAQSIPSLWYSSVVLVDLVLSYWICVLSVGTLLCMAWLQHLPPVLLRCSCSCLSALDAVHRVLTLSYILNAQVMLQHFFS